MSSCQEGLEIVGDGLVVVDADVEPPGELDDFGKGVVPETTEGRWLRLLPCRPPQTLMSTPPLTEHPAIGTSGDRRGDGVFLVDHQTLRLAAGLCCWIVLAGRGLVAQAELQAAAAGLQAGVVQRLLQLRRILPQHRQRFRLFDRQMRCIWPLRSTSMRTSMRPRSAGSSRTSKWLLPLCAVAAISTASPLTGTGRAGPCVTLNLSELP